MRITADTNILLRAVVADDKKHALSSIHFQLYRPCGRAHVWVVVLVEA
jgi:predicted nucleic-acid-binding protein